MAGERASEYILGVVAVSSAVSVGRSTNDDDVVSGSS